MRSTYKVFVYGSLKRGRALHDALEDQTFMGEAVTLDPYVLLDLGAYPGVVRTTEQDEDVVPVRGELYEVDQDTLITLDHIEGHPHFYKRELVAVVPGGEDQGTHLAFMYILPDSYRESSAQVVANGEW